MEYFDLELRRKDLCQISEHLRTLRNSIKLIDVKHILKNAGKIHLERDCIDNYLDDYFRDEAINLLNQKVISIYTHRMKIGRSIIESY